MLTTMLDTNVASGIIKKTPESLRFLTNKRLDSFCISTITEAELLFGLRKKPKAKKLHNLVYDFLSIIEICKWDSLAANAYAELRNKSSKNGKNLSAMDLLIASHCYSLDLILLTNDTAFKEFSPWIKVQTID